MDYARIKKMTIAHLDYIDLIGGKTGNPLAEIEVPQMLKDAVRAGVVVEITDPFGSAACQLELDDCDNLRYKQLS